MGLNWPHVSLSAFSLLLVLFSLGVHAYLTLHYYKVHFAKDLDSSICNLSATFSCDSVAISPFSALMGIPLSLFGGLVHVVLLALLIWIVSGFAEETARLKRYSLWLSGFIALASVVMGFISITQLSTYCIFCIAAYVLSFLTLFTLWKSQDKVNNLFSIQEGLRGLFTHSKLVLVMLLAVPVLAFILHKSLLNHYRGGSSSVYWEKRIQIIVNDWQAKEKFEFPAPPSLVKGPPADQAVMTVVEFADFFCGFCKKFAPRMKLLADSNPDVRFEFYNFPLDGECNENVPRSYGFICRVAKAVHCSGKQSDKWGLHDMVFANQDNLKDILFANQDSLKKDTAISRVDGLLQGYAKELDLNWEELEACMESVETQDVIAAQAQGGHRARIPGTPAFFIEGRAVVKMGDRDVVPVFAEIRKRLKKK